MYRKPLIFSFICIVMICIISLYTWINLPDAEQFPIHWGPDGQADRFGTKRDVAINLGIFPGMAVFLTTLFWFLPRIEPLRDNLEASHKAYNIVWMLMMLFSVGLSALIALSYLTPDGPSLAASPRTIVISMSVLFIGIGNYLGKVRQNFMFGIRTPWTLTSERSWERTHHLGGRLFVLAGLGSVVCALLRPTYALGFFTVAILALVSVLVIYSFIIWKADPDKRS